MPNSQEIINTKWAGNTNLKAYYRFETGALTTDSSGNSHTLTAISDPAEIVGKFGGAVDLDINDGYYVDNQADLAPTGDFTIGCWVKTSTTGTRHYLITKASTTPLYSFGLEISTSNKPSFSLYQSGGADYLKVGDAGAVLTDGNWHFIAGTFKSVGTILTLYVDGVSVGTANSPGGTWYTAANRFMLGLRADGPNGLIGLMDDVFVLKGTTLSSEEINYIYNKTDPAGFLFNLASNFKNN